jgi:hypothetical protein
VTRDIGQPLGRDEPVRHPLLDHLAFSHDIVGDGQGQDGRKSSGKVDAATWWHDDSLVRRAIGCAYSA